MSGVEAVVREPPFIGVSSDGRPESVLRSRHRDRAFFLRRALLLTDMAALFLSLALAFVILGESGSPGNVLWLLPTLPGWALLFRSYGLYQRPLRRFEPTHLDDISSLFHALVIGTLGLWLFYKLAPPPKLNLLEVLIFAGVSLPLIAILRVAVRRINLRFQGPERVFVLAPIEDVRMLRRKLGNHPEYEMALVGAATLEGGEDELGLPVHADIDDVESLLASGEIDHLMVQLNAQFLLQHQVVELMRACNKAGIRFGAFPADRSLLLPGVEVNHVEELGFLSYNPPVLSRSSRLLKRGMDLVGSALLLAIFAPVMAVVALVVGLDSPGPVFFRQVRVGKNGKRFRLAKFRTMVPDAEGMTAELMKDSTDPDWLIIENDPRVTRVGRFLRRSSLDELPQLWHVLKGEMSLVGPRPLSELDDGAVRGWGRSRLDLVPGLTGHWQVLGRNSIPFSEMVEIDYAYLTSWSLWHDVKILARTIPAVLLRRGAN
jgi:exopolysaccharide biosynthesis polyprenyl glycosylphosphotransferase